MKADLNEIMESIQGEGMLLGVKQVFLRFAGCNLSCAYCDTPASRGRSELCRLYKKTGSQELVEDISNPLGHEQLLELISQFSSTWISFTGGEPLLWADYIGVIMAALKPRGKKFMLETNGTLGQELDKCLPLMDMISMDFKLPSATGVESWDSHQQFLLKARLKPCYVKIVITADTNANELSTAVDIIKSIDKKMSLILQPVTPGNGCLAPVMEYLLELQKLALRELDDVRLIPQMHPMMGLI